jgi:hypothetical protein
MNWESYLSKIEDYKLINIGYINGQGCDEDVKENPQTIEIYKISGNREENKKLVEKLPYLKYIPEFGDKWDFINNYWKKNYRKF